MDRRRESARGAGRGRLGGQRTWRAAAPRRLQGAQLAAWRQAAESALDAPVRRVPAGASAETKRIQELERELARKDRALAETAALLVPNK